MSGRTTTGVPSRARAMIALSVPKPPPAAMTSDGRRWLISVSSAARSSPSTPHRSSPQLPSSTMMKCEWHASSHAPEEGAAASPSATLATLRDEGYTRSPPWLAASNAVPSTIGVRHSVNIPEWPSATGCRAPAPCVICHETIPTSDGAWRRPSEVSASPRNFTQPIAVPPENVSASVAATASRSARFTSASSSAVGNVISFPASPVTVKSNFGD